MNDLIEFLTSKEIIVVYIVVAVACLLCFIIYLFDKNYYKRKRKQNTKELNKLVENINSEINKEEVETLTYKAKENPIFYEQPVIEKIEQIPENSSIHIPQVEQVKEAKNMESMDFKEKEPVLEPIIIEQTTEDKENIENLILDNMPQEELKYTDIELNKTEAQEELQKLTEALEKAEEETKNITLTSFEEEQEQNAIISLEELMEKGKEMYENNEFAKFEDEGNEPISLEDLEKKMTSRKEETINEITEPIEEQNLVIENIEPVQEKMVLDEFNNIKIEEPPKYQEVKRFKSSPVISPVYGIENNQAISSNELELENTANYEKLDEEIKKTNEFLMTLRELQKNLD